MADKSSGKSEGQINLDKDNKVTTNQAHDKANSNHTNPTTPANFQNPSPSELKTDAKTAAEKAESINATDSTVDNQNLTDEQKRELAKNDNIEKFPRANQSVVGNTDPESRIVTGSPIRLQRIERVLRDGGMDSMGVIKSLQAIGQILDDSSLESTRPEEQRERETGGQDLSVDRSKEGKSVEKPAFVTSVKDKLGSLVGKDKK